MREKGREGGREGGASILTNARTLINIKNRRGIQTERQDTQTDTQTDR